MIRKLLLGLKSYLTDWKNLLGHALLGVALLIFAIWVPINVWVKLGVITCLVIFNIVRMKKSAKKPE